MEIGFLFCKIPDYFFKELLVIIMKKIFQHILSFDFILSSAINYVLFAQHMNDTNGQFHSVPFGGTS